MITLYDYLPSQNAFKVRLLLSHLQRPYTTKLVSIFEGVLPEAPWDQAQVVRWLCFEEDFIQNGLASLRHWTMTGKRTRRSAEMITQKKNTSLKTLGILNRWLLPRSFLTDAGYSIADISVFAYVSRADEAGIALTRFPAVDAWLARVRAQPCFLATVHPYSIDPHSTTELA